VGERKKRRKDVLSGDALITKVFKQRHAKSLSS
jgi:hypothetical protein